MHLPRTLRPIRHANDLADTFIVVIGLWHMGYKDFDAVADLLHVAKRAALEHVYGLLRKSPDPLVRQYVVEGLPAGIHRHLPPPSTVRCPTCGLLVETVPCPECALDLAMPDEFPYRPQPWQPPTPAHRTTAPPGSARKIAVMAHRFARGEAVLHPHDTRLTWKECRELQPRY